MNDISNYIVSKLKAIKIECTTPQGAFYIMIGFSNFKAAIHKLGIFTSKSLANYLLEQYKVALLPASDFYFNDDELFFRLAFVDFNGEYVMNAYRNNPLIDEDFIQKNCPNIFLGVNKIHDFVEKLS